MSLIDKSAFEVPANIKEDLDHLREWISQQPHLIARTDDKWLYIFLRGCKFSLQRTKNKIENYYTLKTALPEFFGVRDPFLPNIQEILDLGLFLPLPKTTKNQVRYFFHHCKFADPEKILVTDVLKVFLMIVDIVFMEDVNNDVGEQSILCDLDGLTVQHLLQGTPILCKKGITFLRQAFPGRPQRFYMFNTPSIFETMLNVLKPLLGKKLNDRVKCVPNSNISNDIPHSIVPKEYGGGGKSIGDLTVEWKQKVESYRDWFLEDRKYGCDESKRVEPLTYSDLFGIEGSFKKLTID